MSFGDGDDPWQSLLTQARSLLAKQGALPPRVLAERLRVPEATAQQLLDALKTPPDARPFSLPARKT